MHLAKQTQWNPLCHCNLWAPSVTRFLLAGQWQKRSSCPLWWEFSRWLFLLLLKYVLAQCKIMQVITVISSCHKYIFSCSIRNTSYPTRGEQWIWLVPSSICKGNADNQRTQQQLQHLPRCDAKTMIFYACKIPTEEIFPREKSIEYYLTKVTCLHLNPVFQLIQKLKVLKIVW